MSAFDKVIEDLQWIISITETADFAPIEQIRAAIRVLQDWPRVAPLIEAARMVKESMVIRSFQRGGVSYGGDKRTISQEAWDALCQALAAIKERT